MEAMANFADKLHAALPPFFPRRVVEEVLGGCLSVGTLANLDSKGDGPPRHRMGKKVLYERDSFVQWIVSRGNEGGAA